MKIKYDGASAQNMCLDWTAHKADPNVIGARIIAPDGPRLIRIAKPRMPTVYYAARCADVAMILRDPGNFNLSLYDDALIATTGDMRFILGVDSDDRRQRMAMLHAAQNHIGQVLQSGNPPENACFLSWVENIAANKSNAVLECLYRDRMRGGAFNAVREYGYLVTYLCAQRIFGVSGPDRMPPLVHAFMFARNIAGKGRILRPRDDFAAATTVLAWSHIIFGNIFGNADGTNAFMIHAAKRASAAYNITLTKAIERGAADYPDSLIAGMFAVRGLFPDVPSAVYARHMRGILFELIGAMTLLVGTSFGRILQLAAGPEGKAAGVPWENLVCNIGNKDNDGQVIDECLRLNPTTTMLTRRVAKPVKIGNIALEPGSIVKLLIASACRDPRHFENPETYAPSPEREYLNFGPTGGPHVCYGQHMARALLRVMIPTLDKSAQADPNSFSNFLQLPDDMLWTFKTGGRI